MPKTPERSPHFGKRLFARIPRLDGSKGRGIMAALTFRTAFDADPGQPASERSWQNHFFPLLRLIYQFDMLI